MSVQIDTAFVKQFSENVRILQQQKMTRFRSAVRNESITGEEAFYDQLGSVAASKRTTRHGDTPLIDTPHSRRRVTTSTYEHADLIDNSDKVALLIDPASDYVRVFASAFGRATDDEIIVAFDATAATGKDGTGTAAFNSTASTAGGYEIVAAFSGASEGLTTPKAMEAKRVLDAAENDSAEGYFFAGAAQQWHDLLTEEIIGGTNAGMEFAPAAQANYGSAGRSGLVTGEINVYAGFQLIRSERLTVAAGDIRECFAWAKNSMMLATGIEPHARISERADKSYSTQVFYEQNMGSTRLDEVGVVRALCDQSP